jgi:hypothetical protein
MRKKTRYRDEWAKFSLDVQQELRAIVQEYGSEAALMATRAIAMQRACDLHHPLHDDPKKAEWLGSSFPPLGRSMPLPSI